MFILVSTCIFFLYVSYGQVLLARSACLITENVIQIFEC